MDTKGNSIRTAEVIKEKMNEGSSAGKKHFSRFSWLISVFIIGVIWEFASLHYHSALLLPTPFATLLALSSAVRDPSILGDLAITLRRVGSGFGCAALIGLPLGYVMGYSKSFLRIMDPIINSVRQIPIMAWVPLTIIWFGLGDGPTIFLIATAALFPVMLNTIAGVQEISEDYYNAARSMGGGPLSIFLHVILPGSLPGILTGMRIGMGIGWMSVI